MDSHSGNAPEPVLLIIADISGYARYMTANAKARAHSQTIITELVRFLAREIESPLEVAKLEGDAIFSFCRKQRYPQSWPRVKQVIGKELLKLFPRFSEKRNELSQSTTCNCHACTNIEKLYLRIVVHSGEALFRRVFNFAELAGVDVILVHRLLKNSVSVQQYLLLTEAARNDVEFPEQIRLTGGAETYDDLGEIKTLMFLPDDQLAVPMVVTKTTFAGRFGRSWLMFCKLWFAPFAPGPQMKHTTSNVSTVGRSNFALLTLLLTPLYFPVGTVFVLLHALCVPAKAHRRHHDHEHRADRSCCDEH